MIRKHHRLLTTFRVASDILSAEAALLCAYLLRFQTDVMTPGIPDTGKYLLLAPIVALLWPVVFAFQGLYRRSRTRSRLEQNFSLIAASAFATAVLFGTDAFLRVYAQRDLPSEQQFQYSRGFVLFFLVLNILFLLGSRSILQKVIDTARKRGYNSKNVLIVGAGRLGFTLARKMLTHEEYGFRLIGFLDDDPDKQDGEVLGHRVLGTTAELMDIVRKHEVRLVYAALPLSAHERLLAVLRQCAREGIEVSVVPDLLEHLVLGAGLDDLDGVPIINLSEEPIGSLGSAAKRAFDIVVSATLLVALSPLLLLLATAVKLKSRGPILYRQMRMGLDGRSFTIIKFRTMVQGAEDRSGAVFATANDARVTPLGQWMRRLSLDELPQLLNVLRGDMSLVGPRPERPQFVEQFKDEVPQYMYRHKVKTGMTGWAQVNGWRGNTSIPKRIEHDLYYIQKLVADPGSQDPVAHSETRIHAQERLLTRLPPGARHVPGESP